MTDDKPQAEASTFGTAAYGGEAFSPRLRDHVAEIGDLWTASGISDEYSTLRSVVLHRPGNELLAAIENPDEAQMLAPLDLPRAQAEHDQMADAYRSVGVDVHYVEPADVCPPNQMFAADTFVMSPVGAIIARPASTVRAGEERWVQRRLADLGVPVARTLHGNAVFEGADLMWVDPSTAIVGIGHRTNLEAAEQIANVLGESGIDLVVADMPYGTMHLMGMLRIVDADLAIAWPRRTPYAVVELLRERGMQVAFPPLVDDQPSNRAMNFVPLAPRKVLMVDGLVEFQRFYESLGIECLTTPTDELAKAAGNIGCLTGIVHRAS